MPSFFLKTPGIIISLILLAISVHGDIIDASVYLRQPIRAVNAVLSEGDGGIHPGDGVAVCSFAPGSFFSRDQCTAELKRFEVVPIIKVSCTSPMNVGNLFSAVDFSTPGALEQSIGGLAKPEEISMSFGSCGDLTGMPRIDVNAAIFAFVVVNAAPEQAVESLGKPGVDAAYRTPVFLVRQSVKLQDLPALQKGIEQVSDAAASVDRTAVGDKYSTPPSMDIAFKMATISRK